MRIGTLAGSAIIVLGTLGATGAYAQNAAGSWESVTCAQFGQMSPTAQADIVNQIGGALPGSSVTSNSGLSSNLSDKTTAGTTNSSNMASTSAATTPAAGNQPLTAEQLASACQAQPNVTLHDAVSQPGFVNGSSNSNSTTGK